VDALGALCTEARRLSTQGGAALVVAAASLSEKTERALGAVAAHTAAKTGIIDFVREKIIHSKLDD